MDKGNGLIFRYDNAYHHKELKTFPNHKHNISDEVCESHEPELYDILIDIQKYINLEQKKKRDGARKSANIGLKKETGRKRR